MKVVYVAGPYRADCEWKVADNVARAAKIALYVWERGCAAICPHKNTGGFGGFAGLPDEVWLEGNLAILARCDALLTVEGWEDSLGTLEEVRFAHALGIPVFHSLVDFELWGETTE